MGSLTFTLISSIVTQSEMLSSSAELTSTRPSYEGTGKKARVLCQPVRQCKATMHRIALVSIGTYGKNQAQRAGVRAMSVMCISLIEEHSMIVEVQEKREMTSQKRNEFDH